MVGSNNPFYHLIFVKTNLFIYSSNCSGCVLCAKFHLDSPLLQEALKKAPDSQATVEEYYKQNGTLRLLFWLTGGDHANFDQACREDPTITDPVLITENSNQQLYRVDYTEQGRQMATFPVWSELDLVMFNLQSSRDTWQFHMGFPDREAYFRYQQVCEDRNLHVDVQSISTKSDSSFSSGNLTSRQSEALTAAFEEGYYKVPRDISLTELAEDLGISRQAASERLRRGTSALLHESLECK